MDISGFRNDLIEIISRVILYKDKQAKECTNFNTDDWLDYYNHAFDINKKPDLALHNFFKIEVDGTIIRILDAAQKRRG